MDFILFMTLLSLFHSVLQIKAAPNTVGRRFILYFTEGSQPDVFPARPVHLYISTNSENEITVLVSAPAWTTGVNETIRVTSSTPGTVTLPADLRSTQIGRESIAVLVVASGPISLFGMNPSKNQAALFSILPVDSLGKEYIFPSFTFNTPSQGYIGIVAEHDLTWVEVTLPKSQFQTTATFKGLAYGPDTPVKVTLNKYEVSEIRQDGACSTCDLSGAVIRTNKSVAVFSTISLSNPLNARDGGDLLVEQIVPVSSWGRTYVIQSTNNGDVVRVMAGEPNTTVYQSDMKTFRLDEEGQYRDIFLPSGMFLMFQGSGRLQVTQYSPMPPFMLLVTPLEHFGSSVQVPSVLMDTLSQVNSINIFARICDSQNIYVNGTLSSTWSRWNSLGTTGFVYANVGLSLKDVGFHRIDGGPELRSVNFGGYVHGRGQFAAYAAPLVMDGVKPVEDFLWSDPDAVALFEANMANKDRISQQAWRLKEKDLLSAQKPIKQITTFSIASCFDLCKGIPECIYASILREANGKTTCRIFDERMLCEPRNKKLGVRTYVSRITFWTQMRNR